MGLLGADSSWREGWGSLMGILSKGSHPEATQAPPQGPSARLSLLHMPERLLSTQPPCSGQGDL